jgi:hypothetical protein
MFSFLLNYHVCTSFITCAHVNVHSHWVVCTCQTINFSPKNHNNNVRVSIYENKKYIYELQTQILSPISIFHFNSSLFDHCEIFTFHHPNATSISWIIHIWKWNMTTIFSYFSRKIFSRSNIFLTLRGLAQEITFRCPQPQSTLPQGPNLTG